MGKMGNPGFLGRLGRYATSATGLFLLSPLGSAIKGAGDYGRLYAEENKSPNMMSNIQETRKNRRVRSYENGKGGFLEQGTMSDCHYVTFMLDEEEFLLSVNYNPDDNKKYENLESVLSFLRKKYCKDGEKVAVFAGSSFDIKKISPSENCNFYSSQEELYNCEEKVLVNINQKSSTEKDDYSDFAKSLIGAVVERKTGVNPLKKEQEQQPSGSGDQSANPKDVPPAYRPPLGVLENK